MTRPSLAARLDRAARATGIPQLVEDSERRRAERRPRRQILIPLLTILLAAAIFIGALYRLPIASAGLVPFLIASFARQNGPLPLSRLGETFDEREALLFWRSRARAYLSTTVLAIALLVAGIGATAFGFVPGFQLLYAALWLLMTVATALPTLVASALLPRDVPDDE